MLTIERLRLIIKQLQRSQFGRRSEKLDPDQMALGLEDLDADIGRAEERHARPAAATAETASEKSPLRRELPEHLPRQDVTHDVQETACPGCGGTLHAIGETVSEMLDWVPASLCVLRIRRPEYGCRSCSSIHQAAAPERAIARGLATPNLLAQVLVAKYCDHTPLCRQSQIFARHGVELDRSTLAGWVGGACCDGFARWAGGAALGAMGVAADRLDAGAGGAGAARRATRARELSPG